VVIYLTEKETGKKFSFMGDEVSELDNFVPEEAITSLGPGALDLCDEVYGHWRMRLKSGRVFHAYGTTEQYDKVVKVIIMKHTGKDIK